MAEAFVAADQVRESRGSHGTAEPLSQDSELDDVEAVMGHLGDFLSTWDVEVELENARRQALMV
jgi:hypothetical protein